MRNTALICASIALTILCWGLYGTVLFQGQLKMVTPTAAPADNASSTDTTAKGQSTTSAAPHHAVAFLRPFICLGWAYFFVGVIVPAVWLHWYGEKGDWTVSGLIWSLTGGALGALGAFGVILALKFGGQPIYVMPLVFGGAPVVNAFLTIYLAGRVKEIGPFFLTGLIMAALGAVAVLLSAPRTSAAAGTDSLSLWIGR
jgi:hypothetical protein